MVLISDLLSFWGRLAKVFWSDGKGKAFAMTCDVPDEHGNVKAYSHFLD